MANTIIGYAPPPPPPPPPSYEIKSPKTVTIVQHVNFLTQIDSCRINVSVILDANNPQLTMQSFFN